jgi:hypothetical protein
MALVLLPMFKTLVDRVSEIGIQKKNIELGGNGLV